MTLLLLHGLGGNSGIWATVGERLTPGHVISDEHGLSGPGWFAPDLPGHGTAPRLPEYSYDSCADAVAAALPGTEPIDVLGHSFGGVVGLALAARWPVRAVVTVGMRVVWPPEFTAGLQTLSSKPPRDFTSYADAAAFLLRVNGLGRLAAEDSEVVRRGIETTDGGRQWRLRLDPRTYGVGQPPYDELLAAARADVVLAHGAEDQMVGSGDYDGLAERHRARVVVLPGLGHNAHVEDPRAVLGLLDRDRPSA